LIELMFERFAKDRFVIASPLGCRASGPYGMLRRTEPPRKTAEVYQHLRKENVVVSLREGNIRVSPICTTPSGTIERLISVVISVSQQESWRSCGHCAGAVGGYFGGLLARRGCAGSDDRASSFVEAVTRTGFS